MTVQQFAQHFALLLAAVAMVCGVAGCGRKPNLPADGQNASVTPESAANGVANNSKLPPAVAPPGTQKSGRSAKSHGRDELWVDESGQKWFGDVPYDVFFDQPLTVASNSTPVGGNAMAMAELPIPANSALSAASTPEPGALPAESPPAVSPDTTPATATASGSPGGWGELLSATVLDEEVKNIRNFLKENLQSVGNYNSSMLMIPPKAAALGVLAGVAMEHPESVSWKDDAIYIRDLAKQMNADPLQRGAKDQKRLLALFESVADTLNRSRPAGLPEPPETDSFSDVSEMRLVMMRMEEAEKRMRTEAGSEGSFTTNKTLVQHEAAMLATMTHTITLPGYGYEDDGEFTGFANAIVDAAKSILNASEAGDFATYEVALSKISTTCQSCHSQYKND